MNKKIIDSRLIIVSLFVLIIGTGCASGYARLARDSDVTATFESYQVLEDHIYYYSGPDAVPHAIIGIHKNYTLKHPFWKKVDLTPQKLKDWLSLMNIEAYDYQPLPNGSKILDEKGNQVGVWYSRFSITTVIIKGNQVNIFPPDQQRNKKRNFLGLAKSPK